MVRKCAPTRLLRHRSRRGNRYRVYQLVYQLRQDFLARAACKCDTCKTFESPAFPTTNQKVASSKLLRARQFVIVPPTGRATRLPRRPQSAGGRSEERRVGKECR